MRILCFRLGGIGDVIVASAALPVIKREFPGCVIDFVSGERASQILYNNPFIDRVIPTADRGKHKNKLIDAWSRRGFLKSLGRYDLFFDFETSPFSAGIAMGADAAEKYGFKMKKIKDFLLNSAYTTSFDYRVRDTYNGFRALKLISLKTRNNYTSCPRPQVVLTREEADYASEFAAALKAGGKKIMMLSNSGDWPTKKWADENWLKLASLAAASGFECLFLTDPGCKETAEYLKANNIGVTPVTKLREMAALISLADVLVSTDSAARHMADAFGVRSIGLFGPVNERDWVYPGGPGNTVSVSEKCRPCHKRRCRVKDMRCMTKITPEAVMAAVQSL